MALSARSRNRKQLAMITVAIAAIALICFIMSEWGRFLFGLWRAEDVILVDMNSGTDGLYIGQVKQEVFHRLSGRELQWIEWKWINEKGDAQRNGSNSGGVAGLDAVKSQELMASSVWSFSARERPYFVYHVVFVGSRVELIAIQKRYVEIGM